jgi:predicted phosphoadenosine phosphosulfate sulfurtransferase
MFASIDFAKDIQEATSFLQIWVVNKDAGSFFYWVSLSCKILLSFGTAQTLWFSWTQGSKHGPHPTNIILY